MRVAGGLAMLAKSFGLLTRRRQYSLRAQGCVLKVGHRPWSCLVFGKKTICSDVWSTRQEQGGLFSWLNLGPYSTSRSHCGLTLRLIGCVGSGAEGLV